MRESVELAFTAALQHLPPLQRAVLILKRRARLPDTGLGRGDPRSHAGPPSTAHFSEPARRPASGSPTRASSRRCAALGDEGLRAAVGRFVDAWEGHDVDAIRSMLTEDAVLAMPPWATWFRGRDDVADFLARAPLIPERRWKLVPARASGQVALGSYWSTTPASLTAEGIRALALTEDGRLSEITAFRDPNLVTSFGLPFLWIWGARRISSRAKTERRSDEPDDRQHQESDSLGRGTDRDRLVHGGARHARRLHRPSDDSP